MRCRDVLISRAVHSLVVGFLGGHQESTLSTCEEDDTGVGQAKGSFWVTQTSGVQEFFQRFVHV